MSKDDDVIRWRCRACGELQDREAPRRSNPACGSCGKPLEKFDPQPAALDLAADAVDPDNAIALPRTGRDSSSSLGADRVLQTTLQQLARRLDAIENRLDAGEALAAAIAGSISSLNDHELGLVARGLERRADELSTLARKVRAEQDKARANKR